MLHAGQSITKISLNSLVYAQSGIKIKSKIKIKNVKLRPVTVNAYIICSPPKLPFALQPQHLSVCRNAVYEISGL